MSKVDLNALVNGFSGKLGNAVLRKRGGVTTISQKGVRLHPASEAELKQRKRFKRAAAFAKARMTDATAKAEYEQLASRKPYMTAFTMAVTDFLKAPEIEEVIADNYKGITGEVITITVVDGFKINAMHVEVLLPDDTLLEEGEAAVTPGDIDWTYVTTMDNAQLPGSKIRATGTDRPGNKVTIVKVL